MNPRGDPRTRPMTRADARNRATVARRYLEVAELVMGEDPADRQVAAGLAVLAAIAASDALCGAVLGQAPQGQDHAEATRVLAKVRPDGGQLATHLRSVLNEKSNAHYGTSYLSVGVVNRMLRDARAIVDALALRGL